MCITGYYRCVRNWWPKPLVRFPDIPYFRDSHVQSILTTILYLHANSNPVVGYRQGMHELLAPLLYAVDFDSLDQISSTSSPISPASSTQNPSPSPDEQLQELCSNEWIAADAYTLFERVMANIGVWYEWQEPPSPPSTTTAAKVAASGRLELPRPYVAPIVSTCHELYDEYLKTCDPALWAALQRSQIEPQIYGM